MKSPLAVLVAAVLAASLRVAEPAEAATVSVKYNLIEVTGVIDRATVSEFTAAAMRIRDSALVALNSEGGDLVAAMEIGQIIRSRSFQTDVGGNGTCASACVFILAAGVERDAYGKIGIHRPRFDDRYFADLTPARARAKYEQLQTGARSYFSAPLVAEERETLSEWRWHFCIVHRLTCAARPNRRKSLCFVHS